MQPPMKYQPYHGYGTTQPFALIWPPKRIRTRSDWRYPRREPGYDHDWHVNARSRFRTLQDEFCPRCGKVHCNRCDCYTPWKRHNKTSNANVYEKRRTHRLFRRAARAAILADLAGMEVSHAFIISGDYLD